MSSQAPTSNAARTSAWPRKTIAAAVLAMSCLILFFSRAAVLRTAADVWIVSDVPRAADAAVVLGGGLETRPAAVARYYRNGIVARVVIADAGSLPAELVGAVPSHADLNRAALVKLGVPDSAIEIFGRQLANTHEEAMALRAWALRTHAAAVIVPTGIFATRRVRWIIRQALEGTGTRIYISALDEREYTANDWWKSEKGLVDFQNEVLKYAYYRLKY